MNLYPSNAYRTFPHRVDQVEYSSTKPSISSLISKNASFESLLKQESDLEVPSLHQNDWLLVKELFKTSLCLTDKIRYPLGIFLELIGKNCLVLDIELIGGALPLNNTLKEIANELFANEPELRERALHNLEEKSHVIFDIDFVIRLPKLCQAEKLDFISFFLESLSQNTLSSKIVKSNCLNHYFFFPDEQKVLISAGGTYGIKCDFVIDFGTNDFPYIFEHESLRLSCKNEPKILSVGRSFFHTFISKCSKKLSFTHAIKDPSFLAKYLVRLTQKFYPLEPHQEKQLIHDALEKNLEIGTLLKKKGEDHLAKNDYKPFIFNTLTLFEKHKILPAPLKELFGLIPDHPLACLFKKEIPTFIPISRFFSDKFFDFEDLILLTIAHQFESFDVRKKGAAFFKTLFKGDFLDFDFEDWFQGKKHFFHPIYTSFISAGSPHKFEWVFQNYHTFCPDDSAKKEVERELIHHFAKQNPKRGKALWDKVKKNPNWKEEPLFGLVALSPHLNMLDEIEKHINTPEAKLALTTQNLNEAHPLLDKLMEDPPYDLFLKAARTLNSKKMALKCLEAIAHSPLLNEEEEALDNLYDMTSSLKSVNDALKARKRDLLIDELQSLVDQKDTVNAYNLLLQVNENEGGLISALITTTFIQLLKRNIGEAKILMSRFPGILHREEHLFALVKVLIDVKEFESCVEHFPPDKRNTLLFYLFQKLIVHKNFELAYKLASKAKLLNDEIIPYLDNIPWELSLHFLKLLNVDSLKLIFDNYKNSGEIDKSIDIVSIILETKLKIDFIFFLIGKNDFKHAEKLLTHFNSAEKELVWDVLRDEKLKTIPDEEICSFLKDEDIENDKSTLRVLKIIKEKPISLVIRLYQEAYHLVNHPKMRSEKQEVIKRLLSTGEVSLLIKKFPQDFFAKEMLVSWNNSFNKRLALGQYKLLIDELRLAYSYMSNELTLLATCWTRLLHALNSTKTSIPLTTNLLDKRIVAIVASKAVPELDRRLLAKEVLKFHLLKENPPLKELIHIRNLCQETHDFAEIDALLINMQGKFSRNNFDQELKKKIVLFIKKYPHIKTKDLLSKDLQVKYVVEKEIPKFGLLQLITITIAALALGIILGGRIRYQDNTQL